MPLPGLNRDVVVIQRPTNAADAEGNYSIALGAPITVLGTYGQPSDTEVVSANTRGQQIDAAVALPSGTQIAPGDVVTVRGQTWTCLMIRDVRLHMRALLREYH